MLFDAAICDWTSWGTIFCSLSAFTPLVREIFLREDLLLQNATPQISNLTPGTNAVFRVDTPDGKFVIKIYAPVESGLDSRRDYETELSVIRRLNERQMPAPHIYAHGEIRDTYLFRYLVMAYIDGVEGTAALPLMDLPAQGRLISNLAEFLQSLHRDDISAFLPPDAEAIDLTARVLNGKRLSHINSALAESFRTRVTTLRPLLSQYHRVFVHGDLTGDNILITDVKRGTFTVIDFADGISAPACYELPPLLLDFFQFDRTAVQQFSNILYRGDTSALIADLINGIAIHDFGADIVRAFAQKRNIPEPTSLLSLEQTLLKMVE